MVGVVVVEVAGLHVVTALDFALDTVFEIVEAAGVAVVGKQLVRAVTVGVTDTCLVGAVGMFVGVAGVGFRAAR